MSERMTITINAEDRKSDARAFVDVFDDVLDALDALAAARGVTPDWSIVSLEKNSPEKVTLSTKTTLGLMILLATGIQKLNDLPVRPFADPVVRIVKRMSERVGSQINSIEVDVDGASKQHVVVTREAAENAAKVLSRRHYEVPSSVDGKLEILNVHAKLKFSIFNDIDGREVRCKFDESIFDEVKKNIGKRVTAVGVVKFSEIDERPVSIKVEYLESLEDGISPKPFSEMDAIDVTGGVSSEQYVRRLRDGDSTR